VGGVVCASAQAFWGFAPCPRSFALAAQEYVSACGCSVFIFFDWPKKTEPEKRPAYAWPACGRCPVLLGIVRPALMGHPWPSKAFATSMSLNLTIPAMLGHAKGKDKSAQARPGFATLSRAVDVVPIAWPSIAAISGA